MAILTREKICIQLLREKEIAELAEPPPAAEETKGGKLPNHQQWMRWCEAGARIFSTCSRRSYMSIVLSASGRVLGTGYNGVPSGLTHCRDGGCPRGISNVAHGSGYGVGAGLCYAVHAEANALLHSDRSAREGGTLYVNGPPCLDCSKLICGSGIKTVVFKEDPAYADFDKCVQLMHSVGITLVAISTDTDEHRDRSHSPSFWTAQPISVDLASGHAHGVHLDGSDCPVSALGDDSLDADHDGGYSLELAEESPDMSSYYEWLEGEY